MIDCKNHSLGAAEENRTSTDEPDSIVGHHGQGDEAKKRKPITSAVIVMTCTLAVLINSSNNTLVSISMPVIGKDLNIPDTQLQWLMSAYSLSSGCLLVLLGRIADLYGRKKVFCAGMSWVALFTLSCSFARSGPTLDILRALQGVGAAATIPAAIGILAHTFPQSRARALAFSTFSAGAPLGSAVGSVIGGSLTQVTKQTWRTPFYLSTGLSVLSLLGALSTFDSDRKMSTQAPMPLASDRRIDWIGAFLITSGLVFILVVLGEGELAPHGWKTPYIIVLLILGAGLLIAFLCWQNYLEKLDGTRSSMQQQTTPSSNDTIVLSPVSTGTGQVQVEQLPNQRTQAHWRSSLKHALISNSPPPLMKLSLWPRANGKFAAAMAIAFLGWCSLYCWNFWTQLYYQRYKGYSQVETVIRILPMFVCGVLCNVFVGFFVGLVPVVYLLAVGSLCTSIACLLFAVINPSAVYWAFGFPAASLVVVGADFIYAAGTLFIAKVSKPEEQSLSGALFQTMTQLGAATGVSISTVVFNRVTQKATEGNDVLGQADLLLEGLKAAQWTGCGFAALATVMAIVFFKDVGVLVATKKHTNPASGPATSEKLTKTDAHIDDAPRNVGNDPELQAVAIEEVVWR